jgi:16S rRNA (uracil1498-N3)-methyltransferase
MNVQQSKHEFALFVESALREVDATIIIDDARSVHRLTRVLRMKPDDTCIFFNHTFVWYCTLHTLSSKEVRCVVRQKKTITPLEPRISWGLPLLERTDFEEAVYALAAMGASEIYPLVSQKTSTKSLTGKERERINRIMIGALEQAKQFAMPVVHSVTDITEWCNQQMMKKNEKFFFDPNGIPCFQALTTASSAMPWELCALVGPEGDFTEQEKSIIKKHFVAVSLTEPILKASHAVMIAMGIMRSYFR